LTGFRLRSYKEISGIELKVLEQIAFRSLDLSKKTCEDLRRMQFILRVPRLHRDYIKLNGFDPYIEKFTAIVAEHQSLLAEKER
jgi:hypothetical protein